MNGILNYSMFSAQVHSATNQNMDSPDINFEGVAQHYFGGDGSSVGMGHKPKGVQAALGVTRLMQQCTAMLRERMHDGSTRSPMVNLPSR